MNGAAAWWAVTNTVTSTLCERSVFDTQNAWRSLPRQLAQSCLKVCAYFFQSCGQDKGWALRLCKTTQKDKLFFQLQKILAGVWINGWTATWSQHSCLLFALREMVKMDVIQVNARPALSSKLVCSKKSIKEKQSAAHIKRNGFVHDFPFLHSLFGPVVPVIHLAVCIRENMMEAWWGDESRSTAQTAAEVVTGEVEQRDKAVTSRLWDFLPRGADPKRLLCSCYSSVGSLHL